MILPLVLIKFKPMPRSLPAYHCFPSSCTTYFSISSIHTLMHTYIHASMQACKHAFIHTYMHACTCIPACLHTYIHTCMHAYMHSYTHTYMHACMHTYMHWFAIMVQHISAAYRECSYIFPLPGLVFISFFLPFFVSSTFIIVSMFSLFMFIHFHDVVTCYPFGIVFTWPLF